MNQYIDKEWFVTQDEETGQTDILIGSAVPHKANCFIDMRLNYELAAYIVDLHKKSQLQKRANADLENSLKNCETGTYYDYL